MKRLSQRGLLIAGTIGSVGGLFDLHPQNAERTPVAKSPSEALKGDWGRLGGDMRRAVNKVREGGKS